MQSDIVAIGAAFAAGFLARQVGLPPLVGYLFTGFALFAAGVELSDTLREFAEMGVTLLLFSIGLKLKLSRLLMPQIWGVASLHMMIVVAVIAGFVVVLGGVGVSRFAGMAPHSIALVAFALSFSSTVFAVKVLEEKGEMASLYGRISIGILIIQDIAAVVFLAVSTGKVPSLWAFGLLVLVPLRPLLARMLERSGRGELQVLFGLTLALGGAQVFELAGVKGDLGALILGVLLANHERASDLSRHLLSFKDLFLVGFFLSIGLSGPLDWEALGLAALLLLLVPLKTVLFFLLLSRFGLRARTSMLTSLNLANYSEFGLIVATIGVSNQWLEPLWLIVIAVALSLSFVLAAPLNAAAHILYSRLRALLSRFETTARIDAEQPIVPGDASVLVFGMGRVGSGAYDTVAGRIGDRVLGVDMDQERVNALQAGGRQVLRGSAIDPDFWDRMDLDGGGVELILLSMPNVQENLFALRQLQQRGYSGKVAAVAKYPDEVDMLRQAGVDAAFNLYAEAGAGFADHVCSQLLS